MLGGKRGDDDDADDTAVCYKEGFAVREMYQMCDVTSECQSRTSPSLEPSAERGPFARPQDSRHAA